MRFQIDITFLLGIVWKKHKYVCYRIFHEVFEKLHRGTQKMTRTQDFRCGRLMSIFEEGFFIQLLCPCTMKTRIEMGFPRKIFVKSSSNFNIRILRLV